MLRIMEAYQPSIYSFMSRSRYRQYPNFVRTSVPGAGFEGKQLVYARQPIALGSYGRGSDATGMGAGAGAVGRAIPILASILSDPELTLSREGPQLVGAIDRHIMGPAVRSMFRHASPYILPPLIALLALSGLAAYYSIKSYQQLGG